MGAGSYVNRDRTVGGRDWRTTPSKRGIMGMRIESDGDCVSDGPFQSSRILRVAPLLDRSPQAWADSFPIKLSQRGLLGDGDKHAIRAPRGKQQGELRRIRTGYCVE